MTWKTLTRTQTAAALTLVAQETVITLAAVHSLEIPREVIPKAVIQRAEIPIPAIPALKAVEIL